MTNIDRAAEHLDSLDRLYDYASGQEPTNAERAQALAEAGYLMPDLPSVHFNGDGFWGTIWEDCGVTVYRGGRTLELYAAMEHGELPEDLEPDEARQTAYALLAAANYAERDHHE